MDNNEILGLPFRVESEDDFCELLRAVPTRGDSNGTYTLFPYEESYITLEDVDPGRLSPCQRYVLSGELDKITSIYWHMLDAYGIDILSFSENTGYIRGISDPKMDILPVIVEEQFINGRLHMIIVDGMHRAFFAMQTHQLLTVAYIRGALEPYYAFPNVKGWDGVEIIDHIPSTYIKKFHSYGDYKEHFRDFTRVFNNKSISRPRTPVNEISVDKPLDME